jgi:hypothetical protein
VKTGIVVTRRDWWIGIALVVAALLFHALVPRYEWHTVRWGANRDHLIRVDRWFGTAEPWPD